MMMCAGFDERGVTYDEPSARRRTRRGVRLLDEGHAEDRPAAGDDRATRSPGSRRDCASGRTGRRTRPRTTTGRAKRAAGGSRPTGRRRGVARRVRPSVPTRDTPSPTMSLVALRRLDH